jgi:tetratricopeptide (TPR) repeat protein
MAGNPLGAVVCEVCGAKYNADMARCPRCRARRVEIDPAVAAASSRRLKVISASLAALALTGVGAFWLTTPKVSNAAVPVNATPSHAAPPSPSQQVVRDPHAFMDASAIAHEAYENGKFDTALEQFQRAVERNPRDAEALNNLGQVLVRLGRTTDAIAYFDRAIALNPDRWSYHFNRARAAGLLEQWSDCIAGYRRAQQLFPNDYATVYNLALALHKSGDEEAAVVEYGKAIELAPEDGSFHRALAISLERLKRGAEAAAEYAKYLELTPDAPDAPAVRERIAQLTGTAAVPASSDAQAAVQK